MGEVGSERNKVEKLASLVAGFWFWTGPVRPVLRCLLRSALFGAGSPRVHSPRATHGPLLWRTPGGSGPRVRTVIDPRRAWGPRSTDTGTDGTSWGLAVRGHGSLNQAGLRSTPSPPPFLAGMDGGPGPLRPVGSARFWTGGLPARAGTPGAGPSPLRSLPDRSWTAGRIAAFRSFPSIPGRRIAFGIGARPRAPQRTAETRGARGRRSDGSGGSACAPSGGP